MDSFQTDPKVPISKPSSSSSPTYQDSSLLSFLENLSPLGSVKVTKYSQRYPLINFSTLSPVFTSPRMDLQRQNSFFKSNADGDTEKQEKTELVSSEKEPCESPGSIEKYLAFDSSGALKETNMKGDDCNAGNVEGEKASHSDSIKQIDNQRLSQIINRVSVPPNDHFQSDDAFLNSLNEAEQNDQFVIQEDYNHQNICRHLQFEPVINQKDPNSEIRDTSNFGLPSNFRSFERLVHPLTDSAVSCVSSSLQNPATLSLGSEEKYLHGRNPGLLKNFDTVSVGKRYFHGEDDWKENRAIVAAGSNTPQSAGSLHHQGDSSSVYGQLVVPWESEHQIVENRNTGEELDQLSTKKDRKKTKFSIENEGCKRCNCKRSKCLKLYCDCFASGVYCVDSCACENCYNKPEFEDTVLDTRQKIESRNPLAFTPKVVKHPSKSPANIMEPNSATPSSARHKRGCNCKKSKCLKKYCECYQAGVGCSDGCRCEECGNSFGKKTELIYRSRTKRLVTPSSEFSDITNLTPISHPHSGLVTSSASRASQILQKQESNVQTVSGYLGFHDSPANHSPKSYGSKVLAEISPLSPDSFLFNILKENHSPDVIDNISSSISPNPTQLLSSRSPPESRSRRKFNLRSVSPFPRLTPYSSSKGGGIHDKENRPQ